MQKNVISKSREYVAVCNKTNFNGHYFKKFTLPKEYENNAVTALWYFVNWLCYDSCVDKCFSWQDYCNLSTI